jgi:hypothetical protein
MVDPPAWDQGWGLTTPDFKKLICYKMLHRARDLTSGGYCEHSNELSVSIKGREFLAPVTEKIICIQ